MCSRIGCKLHGKVTHAAERAGDSNARTGLHPRSLDGMEGGEASDWKRSSGGIVDLGRHDGEVMPGDGTLLCPCTGVGPGGYTRSYRGPKSIGAGAIDGTVRIPADGFIGPPGNCCLTAVERYALDVDKYCVGGLDPRLGDCGQLEPTVG